MVTKGLSEEVTFGRTVAGGEGAPSRQRQPAGEDSVQGGGRVAEEDGERDVLPLRWGDQSGAGRSHRAPVQQGWGSWDQDCGNRGGSRCADSEHTVKMQEERRERPRQLEEQSPHLLRYMAGKREENHYFGLITLHKRCTTCTNVHVASHVVRCFRKQLYTQV